MIFFRKNNKTSAQQSSPDGSENAPLLGTSSIEQETLPVSDENGIKFIVEDIAKSSHPKRDSRILNDTQLGRAKDAKRLAETKLQGLEESLSKLQTQLLWLRRFNETSMALGREKKRLFELGKQKAVMANEASMLERYDLFEGIHGIYQKIMVVREQIGTDKRGLSLLEREAEQNRQKKAEQEKRLKQASDAYENAFGNLLDAFDHVCTAYQLVGNNEVLDSEKAFLLDYNNKIKEEMDALSSVIAEKKKSNESMHDKIEQLLARRQSMEIHENMIHHGEAVLLQLSTMEETYKNRMALQQKRQQAIKRQNEENELLGKAFAQFQDIVSQEETTEAELNMHRSYIQGQDGLILQERALQLKGRRQMLLSALSLWKRISTGYENIEEKSREVTALRLDIQHLEDSVTQLEAEAGKAQRLCKEKEYTYLLSKGQDIVQLRADLREGVSCSVCGATHHPYHSDTILDQSKLIGQMKTDYEMLASESNAKQQQFSEMKTQLATAQGRLKAAEEALNSIRIRQKEDVQEWELYAELDPTFAECSESTNLDARTTLLCQFIENVSRDAEKAEKELETFTFHQSRIANLGEQLQTLGQKKSEINVRLSELNTGCQVLAREMEQIDIRFEETNKQFINIYENMQSLLTIKDWYTLWQKAPEQLHEQIQKLIADWSAIEREIATNQAILSTENAKQEGMVSLLQSLVQSSSHITKQIEDIEERKAKNNKTYQQLIPERDIKSLYQKHLQNTRTAYEQFEAERSQMDIIRHDADITQGRHDYYIGHIERLEGEMSILNEKLDLWMHAFNQQHPPVQQSELDKVFADGKDWSKIRSSLKQINTDMLLCQAKVEDLNSRLIALETEDGQCQTSTQNIQDIQESIATKQQALTKQRNDTMMQLARLSVQLEDHEKGLTAQRNSAEPMYE